MDNEQWKMDIENSHGEHDELRNVASVWLKGKFPSFNEYINTCRKNRYGGGNFKSHWDEICAVQMAKMPKINSPVFISFTWYEATRRRDKDNVAFAKKFILDAMQKSGKLPNDNNRYIAGFEDRFVYRRGQGCLVEVFVGNTGILTHYPSGKNQAARIFCAELVTDPERVTRAGELYSFVRAKAYMIRTDRNADFISEINGGIWKDVSVSCSVRKRICSICGADERNGGCSHIKGRSYGGKLCEKILDEPTDAYEWSLSQC